MVAAYYHDDSIWHLLYTDHVQLIIVVRLHRSPCSMFTVQFVTLQTVRAYPDPVTCEPVNSAITYLPEFSCHVQSVHSEDIQPT